MKKNRGIQKLIVFALLGAFTISNMLPYQYFVPVKRNFDIQRQTKYSTSVYSTSVLDVGKAD
ncbi:PhrA family quorum-sensing system peptide [Streptococcus phocae subsp. phocae]